MAGIERALRTALEAHAGQTDKGGKPYVLHPIRLMLRFEQQDEQIVALLHDVVEDSDVSLNDLRSQGFSEEVVEAVRCLTHLPGEEYGAFITRLMPNPLARAVKIEDIRDNMDLTRLETLEEKDLDRIKKYHKQWMELKSFQRREHESGSRTAVREDRTGLATS